MAMMSVNDVLMKFFKLPPAVKMLLALMGFGSLATLFFWLFPDLRTNPQARIKVVIIVVAVAAVGGLIWLIRRYVFGRKAKALTGALGSQGPTRGDVAEQEQLYREKFRAKLADLKTNGLSVYQMPWFVLMGEPGCGKTASLIHSGLDFPLGKDEVPGFGGTRNYNWWFTNEAVILDTAGRIAFHEEGTTDKVEWEYFLKLLRGNRPRCPINGVIIALPADKLLRDSADERANKAAVLRERLRQVHQLLGVRFPTFVLVTKMDLVGGFSEYFEEVRVDLQQRNQMFGWSRAGEFQEPYDPNTFPKAFEETYQRLRNWGMRYLQRKATDEELGMIVTFPEAFRQLERPLHDFIGTIFQKSPLLEPPFFRGFYFTSAVQEGAPILDIFTRSRAGVALHERTPKAVDSKAFFIHDFYSDKVFPEQGLVFRSAKHVALNRRMRYLVWAGGGALLLLLALLIGLSYPKVNALVNKPRDDANHAADVVEQKNASFENLPQNIRLAKSLQQHVASFEGAGLYARMLFPLASISEPQGYVRTIHTRFVLDSILAPVLKAAERGLESTQITAMTPPEARAAYLKALEVYARWYGEVVGQHNLPELGDQDAGQRRIQFETLLAFLAVPQADATDAAEQVEIALKALSREPRSFAREVLPQSGGIEKERATQALVQAIANIRDSWMPLTQLSEKGAHDFVAYWGGFAERIKALRDRYDEMTGLTPAFTSAGGYPEAVSKFTLITTDLENLANPDIPAQPGTLKEAYNDLQRFLAQYEAPQNASGQIYRLQQLFEYMQSRWDAELAPLEKALEVGAPDHNSGAKPVYDALASARSSLGESFETSLKKIRAGFGLREGEAEPIDRYVADRLIEVREAKPPEKFEGKATLTLGANALGLNEKVKKYLLELRELVGSAGAASDLEDLRKWPDLLSGAVASKPSGPSLSLWFDEVAKIPSQDQAPIIIEKSGLKEYPFWRPVDLYGLSQGMWRGYLKNVTENLVEQMAARATATIKTDKLPGLARLMPGFDTGDLTPFTRNRFNSAAPPPPPTPPPTPVEPQKPAAPEKPAEGGLQRLGAGAAQAPPAASKPEASAPPEDRLTSRGPSPDILVRYHTRNFMTETMRAAQKVLAALENRPGADATRQAVEAAANAYLDGYFTDWYNVYSDPKLLQDPALLEFIEKCGAGQLTWTQFVRELDKNGGAIAAGQATRLRSLLRECVRFDEELIQGNPVDDAVYNRVASRVNALNREQKALPMIAANMGWRPGAMREDATELAATTLQGGWSNYLAQIKALGGLTDGEKSSGRPPDTQGLGAALVLTGAQPQFPLVQPLVDIAAYGDQLLVRQLDGQLASIISGYGSAFPLEGGGGAMSGDQLIAMLKAVAAFDATYGPLLRKIHTPEAAPLKTIARCEAWMTFLFSGPTASSTASQSVQVALGQPPTFQSGELNASAHYRKARVRLPLIDETGAPAEIELALDAAQGVKADSRRFIWKIGAEQATQGTAQLSEPTTPGLTETLSQSLPGRPLELLAAASGGNVLQGGECRLPVRLSSRGEAIVFAIGLKFERAIPDVIPSPGAVGAAPRMEQAANYLR